MKLRARTILLSLFGCLCSMQGLAVTHIVVSVGAVDTGTVKVTDTTATLDLSQPEPELTLEIDQLQSTQPEPVKLKTTRLHCQQVVIHEPQFACVKGRFSSVLNRSGIKTLSFNMDAAYNTATSSAAINGYGAQLAEGRIDFSGQTTPQGADFTARFSALEVAQLYQSEGLSGKLSGQARLILAQNSLWQLSSHAELERFNFSNAAGTTVAENIAAAISLKANQVTDGADIDLTLTSASGQALASSIFMDFASHPLNVAAQAQLRDQQLEIETLKIQQRDLLQAHGTAMVELGDAPTLKAAHLEIETLQFPAAYTSFLQIPLAATDFGTLTVSGSAQASVDIENNTVKNVALEIPRLDFTDSKIGFALQGLQGKLHWDADSNKNIGVSKLAWEQWQAYGLGGAATTIQFRSAGQSIEFADDTYIPLLDGALMLHTFSLRDAATETMELDFDATLEPVSLGLLSKAFGWPELSGQLAGRIPGLSYRNQALVINGDLTARVFDGLITGRNLRMEEPFGSWPKLFANVTARKLDLEQVTETFSLGTITGRIDADLLNLELFNWSPVAFDAKLYSTPGDRSARLISQTAVSTISNIGGGGGGVTQALQSGVLRFFKRFRYQKIGINCRLRNDVCHMSGAEPRGTGYYIVKGRWLPRINIVGNSSRVDWPRLVTQIAAVMESEDVIVR